jgi:hypothetical protein
VAFSDTSFVDFNLAATDTATSSTLTQVALAKPRQDDAVSIDQALVESGKNLSDSASTSDSISIVYDHFRAFFDIADATDEINTTTVTDDGEVFFLNKRLLETATLDTFLSYDISRVSADTASMTEQAVLNTGKARTDSASATTETVHELGKTLTDAASLSDLKLFDMSKIAADSAAVADSLAHTFNKTLTDSVTTTDAQYFYFALVKAETATTSEEVIVIRIAAFGVPEQNDNQYATDTTALGFQKRFSDAVSVTDDFDGTLTTEDDQTASLDKRLSESVNLLEVQNFNLQRILSETQSANDTGYLFLTDYCDISYFSQPFVGQERNFT